MMSFMGVTSSLCLQVQSQDLILTRDAYACLIVIKADALHMFCVGQSCQVVDPR